MFTENGYISARQVRRMGILENIPAPLLVIPYVCLKYGTGILTLAAGLIFTLLYAWLMRGLAGLAEKAGSGYLPICNWYISVIYVLRYGIKAGILLWYFSVAIRSFLMYDLNPVVILIVLALVCLYGSGGNIESRGRTMEMVFLWTVIPLIAAGLIGVWNLDWSEIGATFYMDNLLDFEMWKQALTVLAVCSTFELFLYTDAACNQRSRKDFYVILGWTVFAIVWGFLIIVGTLGDGYPAQKLLNGLNVMESIGTGIKSLRRIDYLVLTFLVVGIFAMISGYFFRSRQHFDHMIKSRKFRTLGAFVVGLVAIAAAFACMRVEEPEILIGRYLLMIDLPLSILLPILVLLGKAKVFRGIPKKAMVSVLLFGLTVILNGCWYGEVSSIENQDYISSVEMEPQETEGAVYTFTVVDLSEYGGKPGDSIGYMDHIVSAKDLKEACEVYKKEYEKTPDLGHLQEIILGEAGDDSDTEDFFNEKLMEFCNDPSISKATEVEYPDGKRVTLLEILRKTEPEKN